jgi:hypothetical protein
MGKSIITTPKCPGWMQDSSYCESQKGVNFQHKNKLSDTIPLSLMDTIDFNKYDINIFINDTG